MYTKRNSYTYTCVPSLAGFVLTTPLVFQTLSSSTGTPSLNNVNNFKIFNGFNAVKNLSGLTLSDLQNVIGLSGPNLKDPKDCSGRTSFERHNGPNTSNPNTKDTENLWNPQRRHCSHIKGTLRPCYVVYAFGH